MANNIITYHNYNIVPRDDVCKKLVEKAPMFISRILSFIKENPDYQSNAKFNALVIKFSIKCLGDVVEFINVNEDNAKLTISQRALLSDLFRIVNGLDLSLSLSMRLSIIKDERAMNPSPISYRKIAEYIENSYVDNVNLMWTNIIRRLSLIDIVWVIKEIFDNRD